jgi:hypothetical protein
MYGVTSTRPLTITVHKNEQSSKNVQNTKAKRKIVILNGKLKCRCEKGDQIELN